MYIAKKLGSQNGASRTLKMSGAVAVTAVALGVIALMISLSILEGFDRKLHKTARLLTGDIRVGTFTGSSRIDDLELTRSIIRDSLISNGGFTLSETVEGGVLVRSGELLEGFVLKGITDDEFNKYQEYITSGGLPHTVDPDTSSHPVILTALPRVLVPSSIISANVDQREAVAIGDTLTVYVTTEGVAMPQMGLGLGSSSVYISKLEVAGGYSTGMGKYDKNILLTNIGSARKALLFSDDEFSSIILRRATGNYGFSTEEDNNLAKSITDLLGYPIWATTVSQTHYQEFMWIELQKEPIPLVLSLIVIIAAFTVMTTMLISTIEKTKQIGILRTLGMQKKSIYAAVVAQALAYGLRGIFFGVLISLSLLLLQKYVGIITLDPAIYFVDKLPVELVWGQFTLVICFTLALSVLAAILPIIYTSRATPLKAINFR